MFDPEGPRLRELVVQALSSVERGYDLLAPKFDHTPFRTPDSVLEATASALRRAGPFGTGLDLCCGTGAGVDVLRQVCEAGVTGVDFSAGMLEVARERTGPTGVSASSGPPVGWVRADARALPFGPAFDLVVSFGAFGHFLPRELPGLFAQVHSVLRPGGRFVFPVVAPPRPGSLMYGMLLGFDTVMRLRNVVWRPPFVMYYRSLRFGEMRRELTGVGFRVGFWPLPEFGRRADGSPEVRLVVATV
ncbi:class I SAM-dependent methyltransferase [Streptomyces sp. CHD11]|uniref:class I SAM-dependent methyltransferase n=1 Tax=Streptomyces sp. CHD11 TaxID=2741325 RepID=UPI001BFCC325|nr:class I SAM-dependent methyltransferase [Streptomyces sp. CHD11]MBT3152528.1 class I SAM-dependent methyltransferase [Streptomyces sp. CHD11]